MEAKRFPEARELLLGRGSFRAADPEVVYRLGVCEHAAGNFSAALAHWSRVAQGSEWWPDAGLARARTLVGDLGRFSEAEPLLEKLLGETSGEARLELRRTLAKLLFWEGRRVEIGKLIEESWRSTADPVGDLEDHWRAEISPTLLERVRAEVEHAAKIAPDDDRVWLARANIAVLTGQYDEAASWLERCTGRRPEDPAVWRARLERGRVVNDLAEVRRSMSHLKAELFSESERLAIQAWLAGRRGVEGSDRDALERLVAASPGDVRALDRLANLAWKAGRKDQAREYRRRKAELDTTKDRYRQLMEEKLEPPRFAELARLSESLGRRFEARGWWTLRSFFAPTDRSAAAALARLRNKPASEKVSPRLLLSELFSDLEGEPKLVADQSKVTDVTSLAVVPRFRDDAETAGLGFVFDNGRSPLRQTPETTAGGVGLLDYDGDGWLDVYVVQGGVFPPDPSRPNSGDRLFRNRGDGTFDDATERSGISRMARGFGHGVTVGDVDNDGDPDLFLTRWRGYCLYRNRGDGTFEDATAAAGLGGDRDWPTSSAFADFDNDGDLDLYVCHYLVWDAEHPTLCKRVTSSATNELVDPEQKYNYCPPRPFPALADHLFRNDGGRFVDVSAEAGIVDKDGRGLGVVAADFDADGKVDLFVANDTTANYLWHNLGGMKFEELGLSSGVACNADGAFQAGMGTACGDLDGDGQPDLFVTNFYGESTTFFRNQGGGMFDDQSSAVGLSAPSRYLLGFGITLFDANNDGRLDLATANGHVNDDRPDYPYEMPALFMIGGKNGRLVDLTGEAGSPWAVPRVSRGLASGDLDNDGRVDALLLPQKTPMAYLHNQSTGGHFVTFSLEGTRSNRDGVGAVVTITFGRETKRSWRLGGGSYQSASDPRLHFGLGGQTRVDKVEARWPSGQVDVFTSLEADRGYLLREGSSAPTPAQGHWGR